MMKENELINQIYLDDYDVDYILSELLERELDRDLDAINQLISDHDYSIDDYICETTGYCKEEIITIINDYDEDKLVYKNIYERDSILIELSDKNWIDFPSRNGSEQMMKFIQDLDYNKKLYVDMRNRFVVI